MKNQEIYANETALVIVDLQNGFTKQDGWKYVPEVDQQIETVRDFTKACREKGVAVVYTIYAVDDASQVAPGIRPMLQEGGLRKGTYDSKVDERLDIQGDDVVVEGDRFGKFSKTTLDKQLKAKGIKNLLILGTTGNNCVQYTGYEADALDYNVWFVSDGISCFKEKDKATFLEDQYKFISQGTKTSDELEAMLK
jgi:nicotinamidase-related amidase